MCVLQLDRDDGGGQSHVVDVSVRRDGGMDDEQLQVPSSYTGLFLFYLNVHCCLVIFLNMLHKKHDHFLSQIIFIGVENHHCDHES